MTASSVTTLSAEYTFVKVIVGSILNSGGHRTRQAGCACAAVLEMIDSTHVTIESAPLHERSSC
jgi:hypothetical protein